MQHSGLLVLQEVPFNEGLHVGGGHEPLHLFEALFICGIILVTRRDVVRARSLYNLVTFSSLGCIVDESPVIP